MESKMLVLMLVLGHNFLTRESLPFLVSSNKSRNIINLYLKAFSFILCQLVCYGDTRIFLTHSLKLRRCLYKEPLCPFGSVQNCTRDLYHKAFFQQRLMDLCTAALMADAEKEIRSNRVKNALGGKYELG